VEYNDSLNTLLDWVTKSLGCNLILQNAEGTLRLAPKLDGGKFIWEETTDELFVGIRREGIKKGDAVQPKDLRELVGMVVQQAHVGRD